MLGDATTCTKYQDLLDLSQPLLGMYDSYQILIFQERYHYLVKSCACAYFKVDLP